jgi:hypothetical protein
MYDLINQFAQGWQTGNGRKTCGRKYEITKPTFSFTTKRGYRILAGCHIHFFIAFRTVGNVFRHCVAAIPTRPGKSVHPVGFRSTSVCLIVQTIPGSPYSFVRLE